MSRTKQRGVLERSSENDALVEQITGPAAFTAAHMSRLILDDGQCRRINGRYIVGNVLVPDADGQVWQYRGEDGHLSLVTRRHRFRIPKNHPWRGKRPTR